MVNKMLWRPVVFFSGSHVEDLKRDGERIYEQLGEACVHVVKSRLRGWTLSKQGCVRKYWCENTLNKCRTFNLKQFITGPAGHYYSIVVRLRNSICCCSPETHSLDNFVCVHASYLKHWWNHPLRRTGPFIRGPRLKTTDSKLAISKYLWNLRF